MWLSHLSAAPATSTTPTPAYRAANAAVDQLILAMALAHVGDSTRANTVLPGHRTPLVMQQLHDDIILPQPQ